jgi:hypothetical protein
MEIKLNKKQTITANKAAKQMNEAISVLVKQAYKFGYENGTKRRK